MELKELCLLPGYEGLNEVRQQWDRMAERLKIYPAKIVLPNYYLQTSNGFPFDEIFDAISRYLDVRGIQKFEGRARFRVAHLSYSDPESEGKFPSLAYITNAIEKELPSFGRPFSGIFVLDITEWVEKKATKEKKFIDAISYLNNIDEEVVVFYLDRSMDPKATDLAFSTIDILTRLDKLKLELKDPMLGLKIVKDELSESDFTLDPSIEDDLLKTMEIILSAPNGGNYQTLHSLTEDMIFGAYISEEDFSKVIGRKQAADYLPGGIWVKEFEKKTTGRLSLLGDNE